MKSMDDVKQLMSDAVDEFRAQSLKRDDAETLTNMVGKFLKAEQLKLAREIFESDFSRKLPAARLPETKSLPAHAS